jgi:hypothetical protein
MTQDPTVTSESGFTLLDMLVALIIAGFAGSILVGLVAYVDKSAARSRIEIQESDSLLALQQILASLGQEAFSPDPRDPEGSRLRGDETGFSIRCLGPRILGLDRPALFRLEKETAGEMSRLVLAWRDPETNEEHREVVARDVEHVAFGYFGKNAGSDTRTWYPTWQPSEPGPEAIQATIKLRSMRATVEIVIPLRAGLPAVCLRNPRHPGCLRGPRDG